MAESTKVRLVRCPKCENLLPELADYSVYQCGGCGAVLRAKNKNAGDTLSEKVDGETAARGTSELQNSVEEGVVVECDDISGADFKSNASTSLRFDDKNLEKNGTVGSADQNRIPSKTSSGKWVVENGVEMNESRDDLVNSMGREPGDLNSHAGINAGCHRSGRISGWQYGEGGEMEGFERVGLNDVESVRFSISNYLNEEPSIGNLDSYCYSESLRNRADQDGANRVQYLEKDRDELLRKLDELKAQLSRSCNVPDKSKEKVPLNERLAPPDPYASFDTWLLGSSSLSDRAAMQFLTPDKHAAGPSYFDHRPEPFCYNNRRELPMNGFHNSMHRSNHPPGYGDPFGSQMLNRASHQFPRQYQQPPHQYFSGRHFDNSPDSSEPYPSNAVFNQSCSCCHYNEQHHGVPAAVPPTSFYNKRFPDVLHNPMSCHHENPGAAGQHATNCRTTGPTPMRLHAPWSHTRWPSDLHNDMGSYGRCRPRKVVLANSSRCYRPIAGGAPFLTCFNCFELLKIPKKVLLTGKNQQKIRCGVCSTIITFSVVNKKLLFSANTESICNPTEVDGGCDEMLKDNTSYSHGHTNQISANFSSDDSGYEFQAIDADPIVLSAGHDLNSTNIQEMISFNSSSPRTSLEEDSPEVLVASRVVINSIQQPIKIALSPPPDGSPLQGNCDLFSTNHAGNRFGKGNRSSRSDQEKVTAIKATTRQSSMKEASLATEMDVPFHEYSNIVLPEESGDTRREDSQSKSNNGGESFFTNIIKKSFKDFGRSNQTEERGKNNISVNGHFISDRIVKKAERLSGPIHPGQYWYDFRAGFWGVIGGPCLGIIPPFIEELNHPMSENCSGGTTGVFINGRELHQKDLDLLVSRGLPNDRDRSYIIEISGRVVDEDTGEELESLGKLAPTIEKVRHGFGMKASKPAMA